MPFLLKLKIQKSMQMQAAPEEADFQSVKENTIKISNFITQNTFKVFELDQKAPTYDVMRYYNLKLIIDKLSRDPRSVEIVDAILEKILTEEDARNFKDFPEKLFDLIKTKFKLVTDLARSCRLSVQDLLKHASLKVYSQITKLVMIDKLTIQLVDLFFTLEFFKNHILNKSWFHILQDGKFEHQSLKDSLLSYREQDGSLMFSLPSLKCNLHFLFSKIASCKMTPQDKRTLLKSVKNKFGFKDDQDLIMQFKSSVEIAGKTHWFESKCLISLINKIGLTRKYFMEQLLIQADAGKTLRYYDAELFWEDELFKKIDLNTKQPQNQAKKVLEALEFLSKNVKKFGELSKSDFCVCFLEAFNGIFPKVLEDNGKSKYDATKRQNALYTFIKMVELLMGQQIFSCNSQDSSQVFYEAIIQKSLYVLRLAQSSNQTVDMSICSLILLLNHIGISQTPDIFPQVFSLITHAYLQYSDRPKIKLYVEKIFNYYIEEQKEITVKQWSQIQFIMLSGVSEGDCKMLKQLVSTVKAEIYSSDEEIEMQIRSLLKQIARSKENIRILCVQYILQIIEQKEQDSIRKVMCKPEMLKLVYQGILELKQKCYTAKSQQFGIICARVVAAIGFFHSFVNDPILLKATNQENLKTERIEDLEEVKNDGQRIELTTSEQKKPLTYQKNSVSANYKTLELLAVPSFEKLPVERDDPVKFAKNLNEIIQSITQINQDKPKNFYFTQFMLQRFIKSKESGQELKKNLCGVQITTDYQQPHDDSGQQQKLELYMMDHLQKAVKRFSGIFNKESESQLDPYNESQNLEKLSVFLIYKIGDPSWQQLFECCIPLLKKNFDVLQLLLPYLVYWCLRSQQIDEKSLPDILSAYLNSILASKNPGHIELTLKLLEFLSITITQDKNKVRNYLVTEKKFNNDDELFCNDLNQETKDSDVFCFLSMLSENLSIKQSFMAVQKLQCLSSKVDKKMCNQAANLVRNLKRCFFNLEDNYRQTIQQGQSNFMQQMPPEDVTEIIRLQQQLEPEDFDFQIFNEIMKKYQNQSIQVMMESMSFKNKVGVIQLHSRLRQMFQDPKVIENWKNGNWKPLLQWFGDLDLMQIVKIGLQLPSFLSFDIDDKIQEFEFILALLLAEYYNGIQNLIQSDNFITKGLNFNRYQQSLVKIKDFLNFLYFEFISTIEVTQEQTSFYYKLFLHVLYEIESTIYFLKDVVLSGLDLAAQFKRLLRWYEERTVQIKGSNSSLQLIYNVRRVFFTLYNSKSEYAFYTMKLAKLNRKIYAKTQQQNLKLVSSLFQQCKEYKNKIIDFELEYTKYLLLLNDPPTAYDYLQRKILVIRDKVEIMQKQICSDWMPKLVYQKAKLLKIQLEIKIDPRNDKIFDEFINFVKEQANTPWEKLNFKFAQYLDSMTPCVVDQVQVSVSEDEKSERLISIIDYYIKSVKYSHKYIWQSLPRALELWFDYKGIKEGEVNKFVEKELLKLELYKIATVLQLLLSRYNHPSEDVRNIIVHILSKLAVKYPQQSAWWIYHFHFFEDQNATRPTQANAKQYIKRADFSEQILEKTLSLDNQATEIIISSKTLFVELKKLCERQPPKDYNTKMEIQQSLREINFATKLVMPIQENLKPQLPPANFNQNTLLRTLVQTNFSILEFNPLTLEFAQVTANEENKEEFPAFKVHPICIQGFLPEVTIMKSKEKPKKISILGTDQKVYIFLLKCDTTGDLRKEQRFIEFADLCNRMLETDSKASQQGLRLRTYSIVPLSRNTGLIEWIQNTSTLRTVVTEQLIRNNIKGDIQDFPRKYLEKNKDRINDVTWAELINNIKPVLADWFAEHFLTPDLWYEARVNFVKSYAIWSMIGYVIGLGDRHGDNILIHQHTGEVTHVDFQCLFQLGAKFKEYPDIVPFRLTQNIVDAFGVVYPMRVFIRTSEVMLGLLRKNKKQVMALLGSFKHDPLVESQEQMKVDIKDALEMIEQKLSGRISLSQDFMFGTTLTVEQQVKQVIIDAINEESLCKMYQGWMAWL